MRYQITQHKIARNAPFIRWMEQYMEANRIDQTELARRLDVAQGTISRWFSNRSGITAKNAARIRLVCSPAGHAPGGASLYGIGQRIEAIWPELSPAEMALFESAVEAIYQAHGKPGGTGQASRPRGS